MSRMKELELQLIEVLDAANHFGLDVQREDESSVLNATRELRSLVHDYSTLECLDNLEFYFGGLDNE